MSVDHFSLQFFFWYVTAAVLYTDSSLHVVELASIQLKEFQQQDAQIGVSVGIVARVKLEEAKIENCCSY